MRYYEQALNRNDICADVLYCECVCEVDSGASSSDVKQFTVASLDSAASLLELG